jgi:hypothetical protein
MMRAASTTSSSGSERLAGGGSAQKLSVEHCGALVEVHYKGRAYHESPTS